MLPPRLISSSPSSSFATDSAFISALQFWLSARFSLCGRVCEGDNLPPSEELTKPCQD